MPKSWLIGLAIMLWLVTGFFVYFYNPTLESGLFCEKYGCSKGNGKVMSSQELQQYIHEQNQISTP